MSRNLFFSENLGATFGRNRTELGWLKLTLLGTIAGGAGAGLLMLHRVGPYPPRMDLHDEKHDFHQRTGSSMTFETAMKNWDNILACRENRDMFPHLRDLPRTTIGVHRQFLHAELARWYPHIQSKWLPISSLPSLPKKNAKVLPRHLTLLSLRGNPWCRGSKTLCQVSEATFPRLGSFTPESLTANNPTAPEKLGLEEAIELLGFLFGTTFKSLFQGQPLLIELLLGVCGWKLFRNMEGSWAETANLGCLGVKVILPGKK